MKFSALFPKAAELDAAKASIKAMKIEREEIDRRIADLAMRNQQLTKANTEVRAELATVKAKFREQNDADLLLVSAKIILDTLKGEKPKTADLALQQSLYTQQQAMSGQAGSFYPYGSALGNILGGIFSH